MRRKIFFLMCLAVLIPVFCTCTVHADAPYQSYNYDYWGDVVPAPISYKPARSFSGKDLGVSAFNLPSDMTVDGRGRLYVTDTGNNRIVVLNPDLTLEKIIDGFEEKGKKQTFQKPDGITVDQKGRIHIADTDHHRVVSLNPDGTLIRAFGVEKNSLTGSGFEFLPSKVGVDSAGRYYVVADNVTEGIMGFDSNGKFSGYFGSIKVQPSLADRFWKTVATKAQRLQMALFIPTEFTSLDIDADGFVYTTDASDSESEGDATVRKLNPSGANVLVNYNSTKAVCGDLSYRGRGDYSGPTKFADITVRGKGIYSALDSTRGRIFTYDGEGNLLYVFGGVGAQLGSFKKPVAIESRQDSVYVLDQARGRIVVFQPTRYGRLINEAVGLRYDGNEAKAVKCWKEVLKLDSNYELAYSGIGKSLLSVNKNKEAMEYLKRGMDKRNYSVAFRRYRNEWLREYHMPIVLIIAGIVVFFAGRHFIRKFRGGKERSKADVRTA